MCIVTYNPLILSRLFIIIYLGDNMIRKNLGNRIKEIRLNKMKLSQEKFAMQIDMDRTYLASVEAGKRNISIDNLEKIANGFRISLSELFKGLKEDS